MEKTKCPYCNSEDTIYRPFYILSEKPDNYRPTLFLCHECFNEFTVKYNNEMKEQK